MPEKFIPNKYQSYVCCSFSLNTNTLVCVLCLIVVIKYQLIQLKKRDCAKTTPRVVENKRKFEIREMFPWFLCFLSSPNDLSVRSLSEFRTESSIWWNPVESIRNFNGLEIQEGDILVPTSAESNLKNAIKSKKHLWEDGVIPYEFGNNFTSSEKDLILDAMKVLEGKTCIKFVKNENQDTFIRFQKNKNGCYAPIGRLGWNNGPLTVNLQSPECFKERGIIEHELLHVTGLFHEQSRPDRDDFVTIHWCNIQPNREKEFLKRRFFEVTTFDLPYDYSSIMHYPKWAFSRNGKPTITAKDNPDMLLGQGKHPSFTDFEKVIKMYKCENSMKAKEKEENL